MNKNVFRIKESGEWYEMQYIVHPQPNYTTGDVYACYRLSATDGMPIGPLVWINASAFEGVRA